MLLDPLHLTVRIPDLGSSQRKLIKIHKDRPPTLIFSLEIRRTP
jgi:hypothetical protein